MNVTHFNLLVSILFVVISASNLFLASRLGRSLYEIILLAVILISSLVGFFSAIGAMSNPTAQMLISFANSAFRSTAVLILCSYLFYLLRYK